MFKPWEKAYFYSTGGVILITYFKTQSYVGICKDYFTQGELQQRAVCQRTEKVYQLGGGEPAKRALHLVLREFSRDVPRCFIKGFCRNCGLKNRKAGFCPAFFISFSICHHLILIDKISKTAKTWICTVFPDVCHRFHVIDWNFSDPFSCFPKFDFEM